MRCQRSTIQFTHRTLHFACREADQDANSGRSISHLDSLNAARPWSAQLECLRIHVSTYPSSWRCLGNASSFAQESRATRRTESDFQYMTEREREREQERDRDSVPSRRHEPLSYLTYTTPTSTPIRTARAEPPNANARLSSTPHPTTTACSHFAQETTQLKQNHRPRTTAHTDVARHLPLA